MELNIALSILWIGLALFAGLLLYKLMHKINFPNVTGYLIAGIIIGPWVLGSFLNLFNSNARDTLTTIVNNFDWLTEISLGFIAFTIGGSFKLSALKKVGKQATIITIFEALGAAIVVIIFLLIAYFIMNALGYDGLSLSVVLIMGAIACATAPAATLLVIKQYKADGPVTRTLMPVVAFDDAVALITFSILFAIAKILAVNDGSGFDFVSAILIPILEIVISILVGVLIGFLISLATRWFKSRTHRLVLIIAAIILCVGLAQIDVIDLGWGFNFQLSSLLTVMMVGAMYANLAKGTDATYELLDRASTPMLMLFFVISGAKLNFGIFASSQAWLVILIAGIYLLARVLGKWLGALTGSAIAHSEPTVKKYLGLTLVPQAGVALGLATNAEKYFTNLATSTGNTELASLGTLIYTCIIVSTMVYELVGPLITKWALNKAGEIPTEKKKKETTGPQNAHI